MSSVFLRWPDGTVQEQPAEVAAYFLARGAEIVEDPDAVDAVAAAEKRVEAAQAALDAAVLAAEAAEVERVEAADAKAEGENTAVADTAPDTANAEPGAGEDPEALDDLDDLPADEPTS